MIVVDWLLFGGGFAAGDFWIIGLSFLDIYDCWGVGYRLLGSSSSVSGLVVGFWVLGLLDFFAWVLFLVLLSASCFVFRFCLWAF